MSFIALIVKVLYFLMPAAFANMTPVFVRNSFKFLAYPVDFNKKLFGSRLFGSHKTFRGFIFGILAGIIIVILQSYLYRYNFFQNISLLDYTRVNIFIFGFLIGFGVLFGDLIGSFIKRRFNFKSGESFYVLDQINSGIGLAVFIVPFYFKSWNLAFWIIIIWFIGHFIIKYVGYLFNIDKKSI